MIGEDFYGGSALSVPRISKLLLVEGAVAPDCMGFFPVEVFLLALLRLVTLVKPSWSEGLEGPEG